MNDVNKSGAHRAALMVLSGVPVDVLLLKGLVTGDVAEELRVLEQRFRSSVGEDDDDAAR